VSPARKSVLIKTGGPGQRGAVDIVNPASRTLSMPPPTPDGEGNWRPSTSSSLQKFTLSLQLSRREVTTYVIDLE
jgi:hypothetical protein